MNTPQLITTPIARLSAAAMAECAAAKARLGISDLIDEEYAAFLARKDEEEAAAADERAFRASALQDYRAWRAS